MKEIFRLRHALPGNKSAFTLIEALLVTSITGVVMAGLFYVLSTGELSSAIGYTKTNAQSQARMIIDWIVKDVRSASTYDIGSTDNTPSKYYIKFRPVRGFDYASDEYVFSSEADPNPDYRFKYIEYTYDPDLFTLTRRTINSAGGVNKSWIFHDVTSPPFFTYNTLGEEIELDSSIQQSKVLIIKINVRKVGRNNLEVDSGITTEVKIRNG